MRKGFTLVELLIVLAVIAALMAVATPLALNAVRNAKASQVAQNFRAIKTAVENYFNTERPDNIPTTITLQSLVSGGYLSSKPAGFADVSVASQGNGVYEVTIQYTAGDVEADRVTKYYADVNNLTLKFSFQKWW